MKEWLKNHPGDYLAALCDYCRDWLRRDVLPGYRDVDFEVVDLEAWFADRDIQNFVERLEKKGAIGIAKASFSFLSSLATEQLDVEDSTDEISPESGELIATEELTTKGFYYPSDQGSEAQVKKWLEKLWGTDKFN